MADTSTSPRAARRRKTAGFRPPPGSSPGILRAPDGALPTHVSAIRYSAHACEQKQDVTDGDLDALMPGPGEVLWLHLTGLADVALIEAIGRRFSLHRLMLEDAVTAIQRPKAERYADALFVVLRMPPARAGEGADQVSLVLRDRLVLTIDERPGDCFDPVRARLTHNGPIRANGADYLAYALIDSVIDSYFPLLEGEGARLDALDELLMDPRARPPLPELHDIRRRLLTWRRAIWPLRDVLNAMLREGDPLVQDVTRPYLRDAHDHVIELIDLLELYRESAVGLAELHVAMVSVRMNDVMKLLTLISTIFIPLTFVAGVYGMNFDPDVSRWNMPELRWIYGYPFALGLMATLALGLYWAFRRLGFIRLETGEE